MGRVDAALCGDPVIRGVAGGTPEHICTPIGSIDPPS
jgi:hypothetical protein